MIVKQKPCFAFKLLKYVGTMLALLATKVAYIYNRCIDCDKELSFSSFLFVVSYFSITFA